MLWQHQWKRGWWGGGGGELTTTPPQLPQTITDILEYSNKKKLHQMKCELQEWEEKEESKIHSKNISAD